jgi:Putative transposase
VQQSIECPNLREIGIARLAKVIRLSNGLHSNSSAEEFIRRFLQHVLPSGFQKVRHLGFAHPRAKTNWEWLSMLVTVTLNMVYILTVAAKPVVKKPKPKCPDGGGEMIRLGFVTIAISHALERRHLEFATS